MDLLSDWTRLTEYCIEQGTVPTTLDRLAHACGMPQYHRPQPSRFRLFDGAGLPLTCRICGGNHWADGGET